MEEVETGVEASAVGPLDPFGVGSTECMEALERLKGRTLLWP